MRTLFHCCEIATPFRNPLPSPLLSCPSPSPKASLKCPVFKHWEGLGRDKGKDEACFYGIFINDFLLEICSFLIREISGTIRGKGRDWKDDGKEEDLVRTNPTRS